MTESTTPFQFSVKTACHYLAMSRAHLYRNIKAGMLKPFKIGGRTMFLREELERFSLASAGKA